MKRILLFSMILSVIACQSTKENSLSKIKSFDQSPNVIYILADDLGYGDLGCYGQEKIQTPNIDRLATQGILFTQHYSGSAVCAPARSSLLTGQHTGHTPIRGNKEIKGQEGQTPLPASASSKIRFSKNTLCGIRGYDHQNRPLRRRNNGRSRSIGHC